MYSHFKRIFAIVILAGLFLSAVASDDVRLLRFPDIRDNLVAFVYAGDIWRVDATGGEARRLTSHEGLELFPKISPDGQWIAFSGEYSGSRQVFVIPADGGIPRQLTWYNSVGVMPPRGGFDNVVLDWTPDSKQILIRANRTTFGERNGKYFLVSIDGGLEKPLQIVNGGFAAFSPDASKIAFTPVDREFRTWKRYKGGRASDLWIYDLKNNTSEQITNFPGTDQHPVWWGDEIFFASDRDLKLNIWKYNTKTKETTQVTRHREFDVMWPSGGNGQLVYENGGYLYKLNLGTGESQKMTVSIRFDNPNLVAYWKNVKDDIHSFAVSPTGKRALFDARGDIFSVPAENGITENLTQTQGIREIYPAWSPDGKYISYYSDATGEYELYLLENKKGAQPKQLTSGSSAWKYQPIWSPDGRYLLFSDRTLNLQLIEASSGKISVVDKATMNEIRTYDISPDSRWIAYTKEGSNAQSAIWIYDIRSGEKHQLTDGTFSDDEPVFSRCGNFLFFSSNRDFNLAFSSFEFDYLYNRSTRLYAFPLKSSGPKLFKDKNDVEPVKEEAKPDSGSGKEAKSVSKPGKDSGKAGGDGDGKEASEEKKDVKVEIDFEGINNRITVLPGVAGEYRIAGAVDGGLLYMSGGKLMRYNIAEEKSEEILDRAMTASVTADGKMIMYRSGSDFGIIKVSPNQKSGAGKVSLDQMEMKIDPRKEWDQIYADGWRIFRDYFYVDNLHGVDWAEVKARYSVLLPHVSHRADLDYILNEIVSESNAGHSYVDWGDFKNVKRIDTGLLGADLVADGAAGRYRIAKIFQGENWNPVRRSPLTEIGVDVKEGDYLVRINGKEVTLADNPYSLLENSIGRKVELTVSGKPDATDARTALVKPIASELELMAFNWVNERRAMVDKLSGGRIGYIYVPNTSTDGNRELFRGMYAYHDKEALIIDDRYNGGGFIPDRMADLLDRHTLVYWHRNGLLPTKAPGVAHDGPKVMLINGYSSSGGDAFPYFFKKLGLGQLIGTRTWGGLVGISGNARLVDGGYISVPRFGIFDKEEGWIIEGIGVYPDIEVVDRPEQLAKGVDPGIEKAVEVLLKELEVRPVKKVTIPAAPDRSKWIEKEIR
ncbi:MAG TPA: PDZ domain-containing protein [Prolixibacteraceae bacterium]|jgi:tricorn protease|nr:PD40 domain-containing protein [Prolixibacteraceae bacterium]HNZ69544.1 PDZ domain-containing protein [Prolixibacteraceae bacterium]HOC87317.1 PDZ domain-containing protein [Prolixibacteraceae bacterium]HOF55497.1 PDZ domain-containing protein [Prolixibacteraceae bacterium]HOG96400.1 PDZ domain-containing protein [Prolixibacteraceae bacterium]